MQAAPRTPEKRVFALVWGVYASATALGLLGLWASGGVPLLSKLCGSALANLWFGKLIVFAGLKESLGLSPWELGLVGVLTDVHTAFVLAWAMVNLERTRRVGGWMLRMRAKAELLLAEFPGFRRMAFIGIALFVFMPVAATGSITGSFAGRLVGLARLTVVLAITLGSCATAACFALVAVVFGSEGESMLQNPWVTAAALIMLALALWLGWRRVRRELQRV